MKSTSSTLANLHSAKESLDKVYSKQLEQHTYPQRQHKSKDCKLKDKVPKLWKLSLKLTNQKYSPLSKVKGHTKEERLNTWYDHLESLLGPEPPDVDISDDYFNRKIPNQLTIDTGQFTMKEHDKCLSNLTKSKAPDNTWQSTWQHTCTDMEISYLQKRASDILQWSSKRDISICFLKIVNVCYPKERRFKATIELQRNHFNSSLC